MNYSADASLIDQTRLNETMIQVLKGEMTNFDLSDTENDDQSLSSTSDESEQEDKNLSESSSSYTSKFQTKKVILHPSPRLTKLLSFTISHPNIPPSTINHRPPKTNKQEKIHMISKVTMSTKLNKVPLLMTVMKNRNKIIVSHHFELFLHERLYQIAKGKYRLKRLDVVLFGDNSASNISVL